MLFNKHETRISPLVIVAGEVLISLCCSSKRACVIYAHMIHEVKSIFNCMYMNIPLIKIDDINKEIITLRREVTCEKTLEACTCLLPLSSLLCLQTSETHLEVRFFPFLRS